MSQARRSSGRQILAGAELTPLFPRNEEVPFVKLLCYLMIFTEALDGKVEVRWSVCVQGPIDPAILQTEIRELLKVTVVGLDPSLDIGLLAPVRDDRDMEALIAELDKEDFTLSKSKLNAALSAINQVLEDGLQETVNEALDHHDVRIDSWDLSQWEEALDDWDDSVWLRAS